MGKAKTVIQIIAIIFALINLNYKEGIYILGDWAVNYINTIANITNITMALAIIITIISGVDYFIKNKDVMSHDK